MSSLDFSDPEIKAKHRAFVNYLYEKKLTTLTLCFLVDGCPAGLGRAEPEDD